MIEFEWDEKKAKSNLKKHGVSFDEAQTVFFDEFATQFYDDDSDEEERLILLGMSSQSRILVVVHCERGRHTEVLRIISARKATAKERTYYQGKQS